MDTISAHLTTLAAGGTGEAGFAILLIVALGVGAQWLAWRVKVPSILLLLAFGFAVGPGSAIVSGEPLLDPDHLFGDLLLPLVGLCVGLILYEGGLTLRARDIKGVSRVVFTLVSLGAVVTWLVGAIGAKIVLGLSLELSALLGAILIVTGPTVVGPLLRHIRPAGQSGPILRWEGIVIDPIGAVAAVLVLEVLLVGNPAEAPLTVSIALLKTVIVGGGIGLASALFLLGFLDKFWIPEHLQNPASLMLVVIAYSVSNYFQAESGLLATTVMGVFLANQRRVDLRHILEFKENLSVLIIASLFIVLAARITPEDLERIDWWRTGLFLGVLVLVARPLSVWLSTIGAGLNWRERLFMSWMAPRGIVAAAVASVFSLALEDAMPESGASRLVPLAFMVIVGTVTVYGLTASPVARLLGVSDQDPQGVFIVGASPVARSIAAVLRRHGVAVSMVDTNRGNVTAGRMAGLNIAYGNILEEIFFESLDLRGMGRVIAMTPNEEVNTLALQRFTHEFGKANLYRLPAKVDRKEKAKPKADEGKSIPDKIRTGSVDLDPLQSHSSSTGRRVFDTGIDLATLDKRLAGGWVIKATSISEEFTYEDYHTLYGDEAVPMFVIDAGGEVTIAVAGRHPAAEPGSKIIALVNPESLFILRAPRFDGE
jgi:NhaP-type Na+/H+ or K+/H+ antiporter